MRFEVRFLRLCLVRRVTFSTLRILEDDPIDVINTEMPFMCCLPFFSFNFFFFCLRGMNTWLKLKPTLGIQIHETLKTSFVQSSLRSLERKENFHRNTFSMCRVGALALLCNLFSTSHFTNALFRKCEQLANWKTTAKILVVLKMVEYTGSVFNRS